MNRHKQTLDTQEYKDDNLHLHLQVLKCEITLFILYNVLHCIKVKMY